MTDGLGLENAYGATLGRIERQSRERARLSIAALMWISHAERPLKTDELCHALAVEIWSSNFNIDNIPSIGTLLAFCQGLGVVAKEASTTRLIHLTLQEYLRAHPGHFNAAHSTMAETCLSYLNSWEVKTLPISPSPDLRDSDNAQKLNFKFPNGKPLQETLTLPHSHSEEGASSMFCLHRHYFFNFVFLSLFEGLLKGSSNISEITVMKQNKKEVWKRKQSRNN